MIDITVRRHDTGEYEVLDGEKTSGKLCLGEMIELVLKLTVADMPGTRYAMRTPAEWEALREKWRSDALAIYKADPNYPKQEQ